jgi:hypothetical protein
VIIMMAIHTHCFTFSRIESGRPQRAAGPSDTVEPPSEVGSMQAPSLGRPPS